MNTVVTISLAGRSYTFEEAGSEALKVYLDLAAKKLDDNPDKNEILKDFELAVAEKCERYLNQNKNVITTEEVQKIIQEMGPVEGSSEKSGDTGEKAGAAAEEPFRSKKLYRIPEGEMIAGVCNGFAAYLNIDITLVRVIFIILALITHGIWVIVYAVMMFVIPVAKTPGEKAQAFGSSTITAEDFLKKTKDGYSNFKNSKEWKRWKQQMKDEAKRWKYEYRGYSYQKQQTSFSDVMQNIMGLVWFVFIIYLCWLGYYHVTPIRESFNAIGLLWEHLVQKIVTHFIH
jgi:phage shock protein PspC (stress-responsive transcriptional regulator)